MTKAEQRALEFLPTHPNGGIERQRKRFRQMYEAGYEQAEKDLALTVDDLMTLQQIRLSMPVILKDYAKEWYDELLKKFNEQRVKK